MNEQAIVGAILGTAVGDAIGLPYEALPRPRGVRLLGEPDRHRFLVGHGMVSDDTEHTCMVAQALMASAADPQQFAHDLAWRFRWWLLGIPAGIGGATLRSIVKLWLGWSPARSGVYSAGNGPAMRSAILGAAIDDFHQLRRLVRASTRITHTDPKAELGAWSIALAARLVRDDPAIDSATFLEAWRQATLATTEEEASTQQSGHDAAEKSEDEFRSLLENVARSVAAGETTEGFAESLGCRRRVTGYVCHSVPVALHAWLAHPHDFAAAVAAVIRCGGDTDTTAAMVGGILGSGHGREAIPTEWLSQLRDWPRSVAWMERLGHALAESLTTGDPTRPPRLSALAQIVRNGMFMVVIGLHLLRRALPPY